MFKVDKLFKKLIFNQKSYVILFITIYALVSYFLFYTSITPQKFDIKEGDVAPIDIKAPKDIVDNISTQKKIQEAVKNVNPKYDYDENVAQESYTKLTDFFNKLRNIRKLSISLQDKLNMIKNQSPIKLDDNSYKVLLSIDDNTIITVESIAISTEKATMSRQITDDALQAALSGVKSSIDNSELDSNLKNTVYSIMSSVILPNMIYNAHETDLARKEAQDKVQPVMYKKGQNIVVSGEVVTNDQIHVLKALGLLKNNSSIDIAMLFGILILILLSLFICAYYINKINAKFKKKDSFVQIICILGLLYYFIIIALKNINILIIPSEMLAMSISVLLDPYIAIMLNVLFQ